MSEQAVILAAGHGSRIRRFEDDIPKPLRELGGMTLLKRSILSSKKAGIRRFVIVVGYKAAEIIHSIENDKDLSDLEIVFAHNPDWQKSNGVSVLCAKPYIDSPFILMMADHLFDVKLIEAMRKAPLRGTKLVLGVDLKIKEVFDLDDATKVLYHEGKIQEIAKQLESYNALDTGIFLCRPALFEAIEFVLKQKGDASLSDAVSLMSKRQEADVFDVSAYYWQDVDTPEAMQEAKRILYKNLSKPTDGWVSRNINRKVSLLFTRLFLKIGLSANQVTFIVSVIGLMSGYFVAKADAVSVALGGFLFNLASIMDGCDGEMSKLKLSSSKFGEWLDTISDNITYVVFFAGLSAGLNRLHPGEFFFYEGILLVMGLSLTLLIMYFYLFRYTNSGSLVAIQQDIANSKNKKTPMVLLNKIRFLVRRDFFAFLFMLLCFANHIDWIMHLTTLAVNISWVVVLLLKKDLFPSLSPNTIRQES